MKHRRPPSHRKKRQAARKGKAAPERPRPEVAPLPEVPEAAGLAEAAEVPVAAPGGPTSRSATARSLRYPLEHPIALSTLAAAVALVHLANLGFWPTAVATRVLLASFGLGAIVHVAQARPGVLLPSWRDVRLASAVLVLSYLPLLLSFAFVTGVSEILFVEAPAVMPVAHARAADQPEVIGPAPGEAADPHAGGLTLLFVGVALAWKFAVLPSALVVAATSGSVRETLNPFSAFPMLRVLGPRFWRAARLYAGVALVQAGAGIGLDLLAGPVAGAILKSVVDAYGWLAIGCALGLAIPRHRRRSAPDPEDDHAAPVDDRPARGESGV